jgi:hypothetical protein
VNRAPAVDPAAIPAWQRPSAEALESAAREKRPLVVWFPAENESDDAFSGREIADLSRNAAVFIRVPYTSDRETSPWTVETVVPTNKLMSENPSREYGIAVNRSTIIVADSWGNEFQRLTRTPNHRELQGLIERVAQSVERDNARLQRNYDRAKDAYENDDRRRALNSILDNFRTGKFGLPAQEETVRLYHRILDEARTQVSELADKQDREALREMAREFRRTDLEKEINEAISKLN